MFKKIRNLITNKFTEIIFLLFIFGFLILSSISGDVPNSINYQGRLKENDVAVTGNRDFIFKILDAGDTEKWSSGRVTRYVNNGLFNYTLNCSTVDWRNGPYKIQVEVGPVGENLTPLTPNEQINSSAYAFYSSSSNYAFNAATATYAISAGGVSDTWTRSGNTVKLTNIGDNVGIGIESPDQKLNVIGNISNTGVIISSGLANNYFAGNIGIGISNPLAKLHVVSTSITDTAVFIASHSISGYCLFVSTAGRIGIGTSNPTANLHISSSGTSDSQDFFKISTGTVESDIFIVKGSGKVSIKGDLSLKTDSPNGPGLWLYDHTASSWGIHNYFGRFRIVYSTSEYMTVTGDGKMGIRTTSPLVPLHVVGPEFDKAVCAFMNGRVGIETTSPGAALDVNSSTANVRIFQARCSANGIFGLVVSSDGAVSINADMPTTENKLQVGIEGDGSTAISNGWNLFSDRKFKKDISLLTDTEIQEILKKIEKMPVYKYRYKKEPEEKKLKIGFIREESPEEIQSDQKDSISLGNTLGVLMAIVKLQNQKIKDLENRIQILEKKK